VLELTLFRVQTDLVVRCGILACSDVCRCCNFCCGKWTI